MELKMPKWYKIEAQELEDGKWKLHYEEGFDPAHYQAFKSSAEVLKKAGLNVTISSNRAIVEIEGSKETIMNFLAGEFLMTSELGQMRLAELFAMLMIKAAGKMQ